MASGLRWASASPVRSPRNSVSDRSSAIHLSDTLEDDVRDPFAARDAFTRFLEQYEPLHLLGDAIQAAMAKMLPTEVVLRQLRQYYEGVPPRPLELRQTLELLCARCCPTIAATEVPRRIDHAIKCRQHPIDAVAAFCNDFKVNRDGWPRDPDARRRWRLELFFHNNDPTRVGEIAALCLPNHPLAEDPLLNGLIEEYEKDETGSPVITQDEARLNNFWALGSGQDKKVQIRAQNTWTKTSDVAAERAADEAARPWSPGSGLPPPMDGTADRFTKWATQAAGPQLNAASPVGGGQYHLGVSHHHDGVTMWDDFAPTVPRRTEMSPPRRTNRRESPAQQAQGVQNHHQGSDSSVSAAVFRDRSSRTDHSVLMANSSASSRVQPSASPPPRRPDGSVTHQQTQQNQQQGVNPSPSLTDRRLVSAADISPPRPKQRNVWGALERATAATKRRGGLSPETTPGSKPSTAIGKYTVAQPVGSPKRTNPASTSFWDDLASTKHAPMFPHANIVQHEQRSHDAPSADKPASGLRWAEDDFSP